MLFGPKPLGPAPAESGVAAWNRKSVGGENGFALIFVKSCHGWVLFRMKTPNVQQPALSASRMGSTPKAFASRRPMHVPNIAGYDCRSCIYLESDAGNDSRYPKSGDWIDYLDKREAMEIGIASVNALYPVLFH